MKDRRNILLILISLLPPLVSEGMLWQFGLTDTVLGILQILDCALIAALYVLYRQKPSVPMVILGMVYATVFGSALFHDIIVTAVGNFVGGLAMCMVFDFWLKREYDRFLAVCHVVLVILVLANLGTVILFPEGMYKDSVYSNNWLLGHKNAHAAYIMSALLVDAIQSYRKVGKIGIPSLCLMVLCCTSLYLVDALMSLFMASGFSAVMILLVNRQERREIRFFLRMFSLKTVIAVTLVVFLGVILMNHIPTLLSLVTQLSNALGRQTPFNGRVPIWNAAMDLIAASPLIGYGMVPAERFVELSGIHGGTHAHNYLLNLLIMGGAVCLLEHMGLYFVTIRRLDRNRGFGAYAMNLVIGLYFFAGITNVNFYSELFNPLFVLAYYVAGNCAAGTNGPVRRVYKWQ